MKISTLFIIFYSIIFSLIAALGIFGYGVDYYLGYKVASVTYGDIFDRIGFFLSILQYNDIWIGAFISSILQFIFYSKFLFSRFGQNFPVYRVLIIVLLSFSWSHLLTSLNMVRQGIAVNIFLLLFLSPNKKILNLLYIILGIFLHKISPIFVFINGFKNKKILNYQLIRYGLALFILSGVFFYIKISGSHTNITNPGINLKYILTGIILIHSLFLYLKRKAIPNNIRLLSLFYPILIFSFILADASYVSERLFLNYLPFILLSSLYLFKNNIVFRSTYIIMLSTYVFISWTLGPLQNALY